MHKPEGHLRRLQALVEMMGPRRRSAEALLKTTANQRLWMNANRECKDLITPTTGGDNACRW